MNIILKNLKQNSNNVAKLSRKQKIYQPLIGILSIILLVDIILFGYSFDKNIIWLIITSGVLMPVVGLPFFILNHLEEKEFRRVTNKSIDYYKRKKWIYIYQEVTAAIVSIVFASIIIELDQLKLDIGTLYSICIGTFSLVPIIYVFILPQIKDTINATRKDLNNILTQLNSSTQISDTRFLKKKQGSIYKLINSSNHINIELIIGLILFIIAIIMFFNPTEYYFIAQIFPSASILYSLYETWILIKLSRDTYTYNKKEIENKMKNQILNIENKEKAKRKKELLKIYTKDGKLYSEDKRENCYKEKFKFLYKRAYLIIKNKKNKYFVYQHISNYEEVQNCWKATYNCDELSKSSIKSSFIEEVKKNFGLIIDKNNIVLIKKTTNIIKHQLIDIYLADEDLKNANIDYNIDLYTTAKFVSFNKFIHILKHSKTFQDILIEELSLKLTELNKNTFNRQ